jgi:YesN/AraC family two-component response regulator
MPDKYYTRFLEKYNILTNESEDLQIYKIAAMAGYEENPQYFCLVFKQYTGMTPNEFRKNVKK